MGEAKQKRARDAGDAENSMPGTHAPASSRSAHIMRQVMKVLKNVYPDCDFSMFVFEKPEPGREARYNYASTVDRVDMNAVLRAFLARQDEMEAIDAAMEKPAEGRA